MCQYSCTERQKVKQTGFHRYELQITKNHTDSYVIRGKHKNFKKVRLYNNIIMRYCSNNNKP